MEPNKRDFSLGSKFNNHQRAGNCFVQIFKDRIVFIDTCSCLHDQFSTFINNVIPYIEQNQTKLYIAYKCIEELIKKTTNYNDSDEPNISIKARNALVVINDLKERNLVEVRGKASDSFADSSMLQSLLRYKVKHNLVLITQDHDLAYDANNLNRTKSVNSKGHTIEVRKINNFGILEEWTFSEEK